MKVLSLWPPWGSFIVAGLKKIETRSWPTNYRGQLAIHQTKSLTLDIRQTVFQNLVLSETLEQAGFAFIENVPLGCIVGSVNLVDCVEMTIDNIATKDVLEIELGDFRPGRFMWVLDAPLEFIHPVPIKGKQGLWEWEPSR